MGGWFRVEGGWVDVWRSAEGGAEGAGEGAGEHCGKRRTVKRGNLDSQGCIMRWTISIKFNIDISSGIAVTQR